MSHPNRWEVWPVLGAPGEWWSKSCIDLLMEYIKWNAEQKMGKMLKNVLQGDMRHHVVCRFSIMLPRIHPVHPDLDTSIVDLAQILAPKVVGSWRVRVPGQSKQWWKWWNHHVAGGASGAKSVTLLIPQLQCSHCTSRTWLKCKWHLLMRVTWQGISMDITPFFPNCLQLGSRLQMPGRFWFRALLGYASHPGRPQVVEAHTWKPPRKKDSQVTVMQKSTKCKNGFGWYIENIIKITVYCQSSKRGNTSHIHQI